MPGHEADYEWPHWFVMFAWKVHRLLVGPKCRSFAETHTASWKADRANQRQAYKDLEKEREQHIKRIRREKRLRDKDAGAPEAGWTYETFPDSYKRKGRIVSRDVKGWTPPHLVDIERAEPRLPLPLPTGDEDPLSLNEQVVLLVAITTECLPNTSGQVGESNQLARFSRALEVEWLDVFACDALLSGRPST